MNLIAKGAFIGAVFLTFGLVACDKGTTPEAVTPAVEGAAAGDKAAEAAGKTAEDPKKVEVAAKSATTGPLAMVPRKGAADAKVTIFEVSEFQCPFCSRVGPTIKKILETYPNDVAVYFMSNPLSFHKNAMPAAKAGLAAHRQGKFWEFHDKAFANQKALTGENFLAWAKELGLDEAKFKTDMADPAIEKEVLRQQAASIALGARGTPGFFINGELLTGAQPFEKFKVVIDKQLAAAKALTDAGKTSEEAWVEVASKAKNGANFVKWVVKGEKAPKNAAPPKQARKPRPVPKDVWKVTVTSDEYHRGPKDALVKVVTFSEFQCPYCSRVKPALAKIIETYGDDVALVFKHNPLPFHKDAPLASAAAMAAGSQGKFWEMHDKLFDNQKALGKDKLIAYAGELGLDVAKFTKDLEDPKAKAKIAADMALASDVRAKGTPNNFVNGRQLTGAQPFEAFKAVIDEELAKAKKMVEAGTPRAKVYDTIIAKGKVFKALDDTVQKIDYAGSPILGSPDAPVKIIEFSDFQCPYCSRVGPVIKKVQEKFGKDKVAIVFKHFPLSFHKQAEPASVAAMAAMDQGKFWEFHDKCFANQKDLTTENFEKWATELGLDLAKFKAHIAAGTGAAKVKADMKEGAAAKVRGTPSLYINGRKFEPPGMSPDAIGAVLEKEFFSKK